MSFTKICGKRKLDEAPFATGEGEATGVRSSKCAKMSLANIKDVTDTLGYYESPLMAQSAEINAMMEKAMGVDWTKSPTEPLEALNISAMDGKVELKFFQKLADDLKQLHDKLLRNYEKFKAELGGIEIRYLGCGALGEVFQHEDPSIEDVRVAVESFRALWLKNRLREESKSIECAPTVQEVKAQVTEEEKSPREMYDLFPGPDWGCLFMEDSNEWVLETKGGMIWWMTDLTSFGVGRNSPFEVDIRIAHPMKDQSDMDKLYTDEYRKLVGDADALLQGETPCLVNLADAEAASKKGENKSGEPDECWWVKLGHAKMMANTEAVRKFVVEEAAKGAKATTSHVRELVLAGMANFPRKDRQTFKLSDLSSDEITKYLRGV
jgi:hypothetical protein